ncbi:uncharacterized protein EDB91DRAFT_1089607 [Suillus paluster]|uniref:uncharacterized protein n=1 Tax=Suillus paluster TaxID=48578 RepID=UPI001B866063|nr:uncharacterized protein EDB91DRAFT_1089607 [Suillus paluster]KAG1718988.1 hypothetical protein EDB91DRAFT_1089607 [Suillus paluster]
MSYGRRLARCQSLWSASTVLSAHRKLGMPTATSLHRRHILVNNMGASFDAGDNWQAPESQSESPVQIHRLDYRVLLLDIAHNCIQLLLAFGDDGADALAFELDALGNLTREYGVSRSGTW